MSTRMLTEDEKSVAEELGLDDETVANAYSEQELAKGTYDFTISSGKVETVTRDGVMKDAIQANFRMQPLDSNGNPCKRFGGVFYRFTLPARNGAFVPNETSVSMGLSALKWFAEATGVSQQEIVKSIKAGQVPIGMLNKKVRANYSMRPDKNDPTKAYPDIRPAKAGTKVTALKPDSSNASNTSSTSAPAAVDNSMPF